MEAFVGKWKLESSENFEELMKAYSVSMITRKMANQASPVLTVQKMDDGFYEFESVTTFKTSKFRFQIGEEFTEDCPDGATTQATIHMDGDKMIHEQKASGARPATNIVREIKDNKMVMVFTIPNVTCTRTYAKLD